MQIRRPGPGIESALEAEINRVGAVFDRRGYTYSIACRSQQFQHAIATPHTTLLRRMNGRAHKAARWVKAGSRSQSSILAVLRPELQKLRRKSGFRSTKCVAGQLISAVAFLKGEIRKIAAKGFERGPALEVDFAGRSKPEPAVRGAAGTNPATHAGAKTRQRRQATRTTCDPPSHRNSNRSGKPSLH